MRMQLALIALCLMAAAPAGAAGRKAAVLLIPVDRGAYTSAAKFTEYLEEAVSRAPGYALRDSSQVLGDPTPTQALEARKRVQTAVNEGKKLVGAGQFDEAEASFRSGLIDVDNAAAAMERCGEYCDALGYLAAVQLMKGDETGAKETLRNLLAIEKSYKFDGPAFGKSFKVLLKDVQRGLARDGLLGAVTIQTTPAGGRVFFDGDYKGYAPVTLERVPVGKHLVRIERPGAVTYGRLLEVTGVEESTAKIKLTSTPEYADLEESLDRVASEIERDEPGKELMKLGGKLKVERAMIGIVASSEQRVRVDCVLVDFSARRKVARKTHTFIGDEYGELDKEVRRFGNLLMAAADAKPDKGSRASSDPLDGRTGMEDWDDEGGSLNEDRAAPEPATSRGPRPKRAPEPQPQGGED